MDQYIFIHDHRRPSRPRVSCYDARLAVRGFLATTLPTAAV
jgi:hypothetical protein